MFTHFKVCDVKLEQQCRPPAKYKIIGDHQYPSLKKQIDIKSEILVPEDLCAICFPFDYQYYQDITTF